MFFNSRHYFSGFLDLPVGDQPSGAFRNEPAHRDDDQPEGGPEKKRQPPPQVYRENPLVQKKEGGRRSQGRSKPEGAVDDEIGPASDPGGDEFVYRRIDGGVLASDSRARAEPDEKHTPEIPGEPG
jgi:hypothetical protein